MASVVDIRARLSRDHQFYFSIALALMLTVIAGFGLNAAMGRVTIRTLPPLVHVHGLTFMGWIILYTYQNWLILQGDVARHRQLGWIGAFLALAVFVVGLSTALMAIHLHRQPFFFTPPFFLVLTTLSLIAFAGLVGAAVLMRRQTEWHRRLMLCGTIVLINPAWGRLLPMPLLGQVIGQWAICAALMLYVLWGMIHDRRVRGHVHPAYWWGAGTLLLWQALMQPLSATPMVERLAAALAA